MEITDITNRLSTLGYIYDPSVDQWLLDFCTDKVLNHIYNFCNITDLPLGLYEIAIDMICSEFLRGKYSQGSLNVEQSISSIKEGDTQINFNGGNSYIDYITKIGDRESDLITFRCMRW